MFVQRFTILNVFEKFDAFTLLLIGASNVINQRVLYNISYSSFVYISRLGFRQKRRIK